MWDLPGSGLEPMSPALAGRFLTTAPPGKPYTFFDLSKLAVLNVFCWRILLILASVIGLIMYTRNSYVDALAPSMMAFGDGAFERQISPWGWYPQDGISALIRIDTTGLPWWRSGWESACRCRGHGFEPWSGKIPHAAERLGPWATIAEPSCLEPVLRNKRGRDSERPAHRDEEWPLLAATRESPRTETKTQHSHK